MKHIKKFNEDFKPGVVKSPQMATTAEQCYNALKHNLDKVSNKKESLQKEKSKIENNSRMPNAEKKLYYQAINKLLNEI